MKARRPNIEFRDALPHWAPNPEFAQITNAGSLSLPYVERYLNQVMLRAKKVLADEQRQEKLRSDIDLFIAQESNHYKQHRLFNQRIEEAGYSAVTPFEKQLWADYQEFLDRRSLIFNAAYCEGFESIGIIQAEFFYERIDDLLADADRRVVDLWKWHLGEEYEHRSVCFDVHRALAGPFGYCTRLYGFFYALRHLMGFGKNVSDALIATDRAQMTDEERRCSIARERAYRRRFARFARPRLLKVLSPFYNPAKRRQPGDAATFLLQYEGR
jgi:predicted metal-dependent hydrolase